MIHTVIFDIGNVLVDFAWEKHFASFGYDPEILRKLGEATVLSPVWNEYDLGNLSEEKILEQFIANAPLLEKELRRSLADIRGMLIRRDYSIPWIKGLKKKGYQVLYLSNFSEKALRECGDCMDFLPFMDGGILSCKEHLTKPDAAIYRLLLSRYGLRAEECVFLDDTEKNIEAAKAQGIHGIVFRNLEQAKADLKRLGVEDAS